MHAHFAFEQRVEPIALRALGDQRRARGKREPLTGRGEPVTFDRGEPREQRHLSEVGGGALGNVPAMRGFTRPQGEQRAGDG